MLNTEYIYFYHEVPTNIEIFQIILLTLDNYYTQMPSLIEVFNLQFFFVK